MYLYKLLFCVTAILLLSKCSVTKKIVSEGQIVHKDRMFDSENNEIVMKYQEKDLRIWFEDSCVIYEVNRLYIHTDEYDKETWYHKVDKYTYLDLKTMVFCNYKNFSDTAIMQRRYTIPDSKIVAWNFYRRQSLSDTNNVLAPAPDTVINNVNYKRVKGINVFLDDEKIERTSYYTYYMRCDKKNTIFHIDRIFDEKIKDCPATRFDFFVPENTNTISTRYEYVSDTLTKEERKIFKKWAQNAKNSSLPLLKSEYDEK
jgi:hypothetical protein